MRKKFDVCGPDCNCGAYSRTIEICRSHGLEPSIHKVDPPGLERDDYVFALDLPAKWTVKEHRALNRELWAKDIGIPCRVCFDKKYGSYQGLECDSCGGPIQICRSCCENFQLDISKLKLCLDCKEDEIDEEIEEIGISLNYFICNFLTHNPGVSYETICKRVKQKYDNMVEDGHIRETLNHLKHDNMIREHSNKYYFTLHME